MLRRAAGALGLLLLALSLLAVPVARLSPTEGGAVTIRARFVANSDSPFDQRVKAAVRDAVLDAMGPAWRRARSGAEMARELRSELPEIARVAERAAQAAGATYGVRASYGEAWFPEEHLGPVAVAAGRYPSLVVTLGKGAGHNWWGVLFPPLAALRLPWGDLPVVEAEGGGAAFDLSSLDPATLDEVRRVLDGDGAGSADADAASEASTSPVVQAFRLKDDSILIISGDGLSGDGGRGAPTELRWYFADLVRDAGRSLAAAWQSFLASADAVR